ncbi:MAG TPA: hypothetical protein VFL34_06350 [Candidatus Sulfotelmatobacter sp.]|nr:hypothetical protein [Candidatus Sulfotelmatobacter sp.]
MATRSASKAEELLLRAAKSDLVICPKPTGAILPDPLPAGHHKVILTWNANPPSSDPSIAAVGYCLYRIISQDPNTIQKDCGNCEQVNQKSISGTACVDDLVHDGTTYVYVATAVNKFGKQSGLSNKTLAPVPSSPDVKVPVIPNSYPFCRENNEKTLDKR